MGKLDIQKSIFGADFNSNPEYGFRIARIPLGCSQRLRRMIGRIPKEFVRFVLYPGWINFKNLPVMNLNQQEAFVHLDEQRIALFSGLINAPVFHGRVVHPEQRVINQFPGDWLFFGECSSTQGARCQGRSQQHEFVE